MENVSKQRGFREKHISKRKREVKELVGFFYVHKRVCVVKRVACKHVRLGCDFNWTILHVWPGAVIPQPWIWKLSNVSFNTYRLFQVNFIHNELTVFNASLHPAVITLPLWRCLWTIKTDRAPQHLQASSLHYLIRELNRWMSNGYFHFQEFR